ncbi:baculoviral IAP repeat-containing protein 2-like isoform X2 [Biomphalaria glabrata]|uniref:Baculoviral IAP repeat-containing protein 2-like isoform X2 n=1 Tax=Biomphalaria glabrata TaxID=6526 RepID=A0A9W3AMZ2_BIOGL|nr:baculoviral IAP repeat-containing protein 2-like isoform X2 [Biomphalaria glabrata]
MKSHPCMDFFDQALGHPEQKYKDYLCLKTVLRDQTIRIICLSGMYKTLSEFKSFLKRKFAKLINQAHRIVRLPIIFICSPVNSLTTRKKNITGSKYKFRKKDLPEINDLMLLVNKNISLKRAHEHLLTVSTDSAYAYGPYAQESNVSCKLLVILTSVSKEPIVLQYTHNVAGYTDEINHSKTLEIDSVVCRSQDNVAKGSINLKPELYPKSYSHHGVIKEDFDERLSCQQLLMHTDCLADKGKTAEFSHTLNESSCSLNLSGKIAAHRKCRKLKNIDHGVTQLELSTSLEMCSICNKKDATNDLVFCEQSSLKYNLGMKQDHAEVILQNLGELLKFKQHHTFPQTLQLYPVFNQNRRPDIRELMRYEICRMCSFAYANHPEGLNMWFTQLAQAGFYYTYETRRISCFSCGYVCDVTNAESIEMANQHECRRHERNIPLNEWTRGIDSGDLLLYQSIFGGLTSSFFESGLDHQDSNATNQLVPSIGSASGGQDVNNGFTEVVDVRETRLPSSYPDTTEGSVSQSHQSLPTNLNEVSGSVVFQESDVSESREVLTSKSIEPVPFTHTPSQAATIPETSAEETNNAQNPPEEGAVGGHTASFELSGASYPQFASSSARRATFTGWNPDHPQRPDDLAAGGFFYAGYADCVRCFNCGLGLKYWRPSDIPAYQHARFRPNCVYNKMYKGQDYINKVQQDLQEEQARVQAAENNRPDNQVVTEFTDLSGPEQPPPPPPPDPSPASNEQDHEYLRLPAAQEALRVGWRSDQVIQAVTNVVEEIGVTAQNLQQDVLFDVLRELYSADDVPASTGINNSRRDDSISSSSIADTSMATIRPRISDEPINTSDKLSSLANASESRATEENTAAGAFEVPDGSSREDPIEQYQAIVRENAYLNQRTICMICQMRPVGCVFLPCGHVIACQICALNERTCRACNKVIVGTSSVYLS